MNSLESTDIKNINNEEFEYSGFYPWRRFFARSLDLSIYVLVWSIVLALVFNVFWPYESSAWSLINFFSDIGLFMLVEPLLLSKFGTTPGKAIFGIKIKRADGNLLTYKEALTRTWNVLRYGCGFYIPFYNIWRLWKSYGDCRDGFVLKWDENLSYTVKDTHWYRIAGFVSARLGLAALAALLSLLQFLPPNQGDITVEQYVENYNHYIRMTGGTQANPIFSRSGEKMLYRNEIPEFEFKAEEGYVTGVTYKKEIHEKSYLDSNERTMQIMTLAFVGAQKDESLWKKAPLYSRNKMIWLNDFEQTYKTVLVTNQVEYEGYNIWGDFDYLWPKEDAENYFFSQKFIVEKK